MIHQERNILVGFTFYRFVVPIFCCYPDLPSFRLITVTFACLGKKKKKCFIISTIRSVTDIYIFAIGEDIFDDDLKPLTAGEDGKHYFRMKDISNLQETFDDIIGK